MKKNGCWVCPVCGALFTANDVEHIVQPIVHCLECNHHYPPYRKRCRNCGGTRLVSTIPSKLTVQDAIALSEWSERNGYRRGTEITLLPNGTELLGGIEVEPPQRNLSVSQRAIIAARMKQMLDER